MYLKKVNNELTSYYSIILVRHGECHANTDESKFATEPDYTIELTENGIRQAYEAGLKLKELVENETLYFYVSPFWRTRFTFENIVRSFPRSQFEYSEEPRLREQEWGYLRTYAELKQLKKERKEYGIFYYRFPGGEAGTDVYDRINDLLGSLHRDFQRENYPRNCILVTHSLAIRLFIMRWFHLTVEEFEQMLSPKNGQLVVLQLNEETDDYELLTPLERDEKLFCEAGLSGCPAHNSKPSRRKETAPRSCYVFITPNIKAKIFSCGHFYFIGCFSADKIVVAENRMVTHMSINVITPQEVATHTGEIKEGWTSYRDIAIKNLQTENIISSKYLSLRT